MFQTFDNTIQEGLIRLGAFVILGLLIRHLSLKFPMQAYDNQKIDRFDIVFTLLALVVAVGVEEWINPLLLQALKNSTSWLQQAVDWVNQSGTGMQILVYLVLTDFLGYGVHRLMHTPWIWRVHAFHHSVRSLNWVSGIRGSPWHIILILLPGTLIASVLLLPQNPMAFMTILLIDIASQHLNHSNLRLPFASKLEWILVTPQMHFLHHSEDPRYGQCNYGFYFSFWDRVFGTYVDAQTVNTKGPLGLAENYSTSSMLWGVRLKKRS
jgi:sterol desaturase/sphingolipid hydroxylase (fatty acid hydroxylase superfamily)